MVRSRLLWIPPLAALAFLGVMLFLTTTGEDRPLPQPAPELDRSPPPPVRALAPPPRPFAVKPAAPAFQPPAPQVAPAPVPPPPIVDVPTAGSGPMTPMVDEGLNDPDVDGPPHRRQPPRLHRGTREEPAAEE